MRSALAALLRMMLTPTALSGAVAVTVGMLFVLNQPGASEAGAAKDALMKTARVSQAAEEERRFAPLSREPQRVQPPPTPFTIEPAFTKPGIARPKPVRVETLSRKEWRDLLGGTTRGNVKDQWAQVTARSLNVRAEPGLSANVKSQFAQGTRVEVLEVREGWSRVRAEEGPDSGWVSSRYLKVADAARKPERSAARRTRDTVRK